MAYMGNVIAVNFSQISPLDACADLLADFHEFLLDISNGLRDNLAKALQAFAVFDPFWLQLNSAEAAAQYRELINDILTAWWGRYGVDEALVIEGAARLCLFRDLLVQLPTVADRQAAADQLFRILYAYA